MATAGGDFTNGDGSGGESIYGYSFEDEEFAAKHNEKFQLCMARNEPNTNGSQSFITTESSPHLKGTHVPFERVVVGDKVVTRIENLEVSESGRPLADVQITNCGESLRKRKVVETSSSDSDSSSDEESKKKKKKTNRKKRRKSDNDVEGAEEKKRSSAAQVQVSTVRVEDLPKEPKNQHSFLMRRSKTPEEIRKKKKTYPKRYVDRDDPEWEEGSSYTCFRQTGQRDKSGYADRSSLTSDKRSHHEYEEENTMKGKVKVKGRGQFKCNRLDLDRIPPHWRKEQDRLLSLEQLAARREELADRNRAVEYRKRLEQEKVDKKEGSLSTNHRNKESSEKAAPAIVAGLDEEEELDEDAAWRDESRAEKDLIKALNAVKIRRSRSPNRNTSSPFDRYNRNGLDRDGRRSRGKDKDAHRRRSSDLDRDEWKIPKSMNENSRV